ncbi:MAG: TonB-dependent receptor [Gammaproteobacteria bacterium]|nr:TonB-dependent receptor [Gammaproteobacteria bacterium]
MVEDLPFLGDARFSLEMSYLNRDSDQRLAEVPLAPLAFFSYSAPYTVDNYYNPFGADIHDWRRRMVEGGSRFENTLTETKRVLVGLDGELGSWDYDMYASFGETASEGHFGHIYNLERVANAVGPSLQDEDGNWVLDSDGNPQCANDTAACVPLNVFGEGSVTQEMIDYITFVDNQASLQDQKALALNFVNSDFMDLPAGPLGAAFGFEWREERGSDTPDSQVNALGSAATGTPRKPTSGEYSVQEIYGELVVPLLGETSISDSFELSLATRYSDYNPFGDTTNSNVGLKWRFSDQFMARMKFSQAFRAPSTSHLFGGSGFSFPAISDPCSTNPTSHCIADGVPASGFQPISTQIRTTVGGNPNAQPETADIFTYGFVYEPSFLVGLAITIDHYDIELTNALATLGADFIVESCAESGQYCHLIERFSSGPNAGNPINVTNTVTNVGGVNTSGWDIGVRYLGLDLLGGTFDFRFEATRLSNYETVQADGSVLNLTGRFDDDQDGYFTKLRHNFDIVYNRNNLSLSSQFRTIGEADETAFDWATGEDVERVLNARTYLDLQGSYDFPDLDMIIALGIDNVLDEDPPLSLDGFNDNTDVRTFDTAGRYYFLKVTLTR